MSKDIRSYFFKSHGSSKHETEPDSPQNKKRKRKVVESDDENDDDDDFIQSKKKAKEQPIPAKEKKKPEVIVQVENYFGSTPIEQKKQKIVSKNPEVIQAPSAKKSRRSDKKERKEKRNSHEVAFESDPELEASILQADVEESVLTEKNKEVGSRGKDEVVNGKSKTPKKEVKDKKSTPNKETGGEKKTPKKEVTLDVEPNKTPKQVKANIDNALLSSEQKRRNAEAYQKYLNRSGPKNPGSKTIPQGTPTCLQNLTFIITGVLDSLEREEAIELIKKCGGRVTSSVSKKTDYIVVGEEPGISKIQKAENFGTKKIDEDGLLELIRNKSEEAESEKDSFIESTPEKASKSPQKKYARKRVTSVEETKYYPTPSKKPNNVSKEMEKKIDKVEVAGEDKGLIKHQEFGKVKLKNFVKTGGEMLWVDKYKPKSTKNIIGQMGDKSNVKKLIKWLQNWHKNHSNKNGKKSVRPAPWAVNDDGGYYKAALLSGPPGVGKTTTIHLVCEELGLDVVEFNASDTRSKRLLQEDVSELLSSKSIRGFFEVGGEKLQKHVLVMDEVDGMAGNEDRGGIQELIQLIKNTKVPIVGICNERNHPKMRSLVNYCFDLRFQRPRAEQIKSAMKSICFKEKLDISGEALEELIFASNHDVRQVLHNLALLSSGQKPPTLEEAKKKGAEAKKTLNLSPWDVTRKVFSASEQEKMSFMDKTDLFFQDYSTAPLFVQDNYLRVRPYKARNCELKKLELISEAADSLALGDVVEKAIRSQNAWNLLPVQAVFSSVLPGHRMSGNVQGQIQFPVWLGKNAKTYRFDKLLQDLNSTLRMSATATKESVNLDYLSHLKKAIVRPLVEEGSRGVQSSVQFMQSYYLTKDDLDNILELSSWPGVKDSFSEVDPKVKAALTRALNKGGQLALRTKKTSKILGDDDYFNVEDGEEEEEETEGDTVDSDPMIKVGKSNAKKETLEKGNKENKKGGTKKETAGKRNDKKAATKKGKG